MWQHNGSPPDRTIAIFVVQKPRGRSAERTVSKGRRSKIWLRPGRHRRRIRWTIGFKGITKDFLVMNFLSKIDILLIKTGSCEIRSQSCSVWFRSTHSHWNNLGIGRYLCQRRVHPQKIDASGGTAWTGYQRCQEIWMGITWKWYVLFQRNFSYSSNI